MIIFSNNRYFERLFHIPQKVCYHIHNRQHLNFETTRWLTWIERKQTVESSTPI